MKKTIFVIIIIISFLIISTSCKEKPEADSTNIKIEEFIISSPSKEAKITYDGKPLKITGILKYDGPNFNKYSICIYKLVDGKYYWQNAAGNVIISGELWTGSVDLQKEGFSPEEKLNGYKEEDIVAFIVEKSKIPVLPGSEEPTIGVKKSDIDSVISQELNTNSTLPLKIKNMIKK